VIRVTFTNGEHVDVDLNRDEFMNELHLSETLLVDFPSRTINRKQIVQIMDLDDEGKN
jgi:hypothetical protein